MQPVKQPYRFFLSFFCLSFTVATCVIFFACRLQTPGVGSRKKQTSLLQEPICSAVSMQKTVWKKRRPPFTYKLFADKMQILLQPCHGKYTCTKNLQEVRIDFFFPSNSHNLAIHQLLSPFAIYSFQEKSLFFPKATIHRHKTLLTDPIAQTMRLENVSAFLGEELEITSPRMQLIQ